MLIILGVCVCVCVCGLCDRTSIAQDNSRPHSAKVRRKKWVSECATCATSGACGFKIECLMNT